MKSKNILVALLVILLCFAWFLFGLSEERRVRKVFARTTEAFEKTGPEPIFTSTAKARALANVAAPGMTFDCPERNLHFTVNDTIYDSILLLRKDAPTIGVSFEDLAVTFTADDTAVATCDCFYRGNSDILGFSGRDARALTATLVKDKKTGEWRFSAIRLAPIIEK